MAEVEVALSSLTKVRLMAEASTILFPAVMTAGFLAWPAWGNGATDGQAAFAVRVALSVAMLTAGSALRLVWLLVRSGMGLAADREKVIQ